jgi:hypothetical protein
MDTFSRKIAPEGKEDLPKAKFSVTFGKGETFNG